MTQRNAYLLCLPIVMLSIFSTALAEDFESDSSHSTKDAIELELSKGDLLVDDVDLFELELPEVVFAAGRREQEVETLPYSISVITAEEIRRAGALTVADAIRLAPGTNVAQYSGNSASVSIRGFQGLLSKQLLVLVDGRQIFDPFFGGTLWGIWPFQIEDIERIEIIRGPAGLTWGPNAVNGVINIITKSPVDQPAFVFRAGAGTQGWSRNYFSYSFNDEKLSFRISGEYERSDGHVRGGTEISPIDDNYQTGKMNLKGSYIFNEQDSLEFAAGSSVLDGGIPGAPLLGDQQQGRGQANFLQLSWHRAIEEDNNLTLTTYVNDSHVVWGVRAFDMRYQQVALQLTHTFKPNDDHTITWGIDTRYDYTDGSGGEPRFVNRNYVSSGMVGIYLQDQWWLDDHWLLNAGARIDYGTHSGFEPSARVGVGYHWSNDHSVFVAASRAVHVPAAAYNYGDLSLLGGLGVLRSNSLLDSQPVMAYEIGYNGTLLDERLSLSASWFWHEYRRIFPLNVRLFDPAPYSQVVDNTASVSMYGAELEADFELSEDWRILGHYTYQQMDWHSDDSTPRHGDIDSAPRHQFMVGLQHHLTDDLHLSAHWYFVDDLDVPNPHNPFSSKSIRELHRLDLTAEYEFWEDRAAITVGVKNLLDNHHSEAGSITVNDTEVPRMIFGEIRLSLP